MVLPTFVGIDDVGYEELLQFGSGAQGMAFDLAEDSTGVMCCCRMPTSVHEGDSVRGDAAPARGAGWTGHVGPRP